MECGRKPQPGSTSPNPKLYPGLPQNDTQMQTQAKTIAQQIDAVCTVLPENTANQPRHPLL